MRSSTATSHSLRPVARLIAAPDIPVRARVCISIYLCGDGLAVVSTDRPWPSIARHHLADVVVGMVISNTWRRMSPALRTRCAPTTTAGDQNARRARAHANRLGRSLEGIAIELRVLGITAP